MKEKQKQQKKKIGLMKEKQKQKNKKKKNERKGPRKQISSTRTPHGAKQGEPRCTIYL
jgi:hypothetical protein